MAGSGAKGPFEGRWLRDNVDMSCTSCPVDYEHEPTLERPRRCVHRGLNYLGGVHCGEDTGLGLFEEKGQVRHPVSCFV